MHKSILVLVIASMGNLLFGFVCPQSDMPGTLAYQYARRDNNSSEDEIIGLTQGEFAGAIVGTAAGIGILGSVAFGSDQQPAPAQTKKNIRQKQRQFVAASVPKRRAMPQKKTATKARTSSRARTPTKVNPFSKASPQVAVQRARSPVAQKLAKKESALRKTAQKRAAKR